MHVSSRWSDTTRGRSACRRGSWPAASRRPSPVHLVNRLVTDASAASDKASHDHDSMGEGWEAGCASCERGKTIVHHSFRPLPQTWRTLHTPLRPSLEYTKVTRLYPISVIPSHQVRERDVSSRQIEIQFNPLDGPLLQCDRASRLYSSICHRGGRLCSSLLIYVACQFKAYYGTMCTT